VTRAWLVAALAGGLLAAGARAHEIRPAYLELREVEPERFDVIWKVPMRGELQLDLEPVLPASCAPTGPIAGYAVPGALVERWSVVCEGGLLGQTVAVAGLEATLTDVLVRVQLLEGGTRTARLSPGAVSHTLATVATRTEVAGIYLLLGVEHILGGIDHLLFVLALLLIVSGWRPMLITVTAFTVAHSVTLAVAVLGFVSVPQAPVEAAIALSIVLLAAEILRVGAGGGAGLLQRYPWLISFAFGLLHGFGFAGALSEVGLPSDEIPIALLFFNVGVEVGQVAFVLAAVATMWLLSRVRLPWPTWAPRVVPYAVGSVAAFWTIQRTVGFWLPG